MDINGSKLHTIQKFWSDLICDEEAPMTNRIKASELLYKSLNNEESIDDSENMPLDKKIKLVKNLLKTPFEYEEG